MQPSQPIGEREREILTAIVETFIATGDPVGSRTLARSNKEGLSPASIRNVMADLADAGYLAQPHTSAGRVPTARAFQDFVAAVSPRPVGANERERIFARFHDSESLEERIGTTSRVLTEMTRNVGIA